MSFIQRWDRVTGYILLMIGIAGAWSSVHLKMGQFRHPGPGFLPFGLSILLILLSLVLVFSRWERDAQPARFWPERTWLRPLLGVAILFFYAVVIETLGFPPTTFVFLVIWMLVIERLRWVTVILISLGTTAALYLIFGFFLEVPLPPGFLK